MATRVVYMPDTEPAPAPKRESVTEQATAALLLGAFTALLLFVLSLFVPVDWQVRLLIPPAIGAALAAVAGLVLVWTAAVRHWRIEDATRERQWKHEDEDRKRVALLLQQAERDVTHTWDDDNQPATLTRAQSLELLALRLLERHYVHRLSISRAVCEKQLSVKQQDWNHVMRLFLARGIRVGRQMRDDLNLETALSLWRSGAKRNTRYTFDDHEQGDPPLPVPVS